MKKLHLVTQFFVIALLLSACANGTIPSSASSTSNQTPVSSTPSLTLTVTVSPSATPNATNNQCRQDPLAGVYNPQRLEIKEPCKTVTGTVDKVTHEKDGDYHINLKLDPEFAGLINDKNVSGEHGNLVVEIIPMDEQKIPAPKKGQHIKITGSYVLDKHHGWMEIHPAWIIDDKGSVDFKAADAKISAGSLSDEDVKTSEQPTKNESIEPSSTPDHSTLKKQEPVKIISVSSPAARNSNATLIAKVTPGATASIQVNYKSGPSKAEGLENKQADANGNVSWTWHVGGRTTLGSWPITVSCNGASVETEFEVLH